MRTQDFVRAAAGLVATAFFAAGAASAQEAIQQPEPLTMTDTAPTPAHDRSSMGAVIIMDQPVLAQRQAMATAMERTSVDTQSMGAGPARVLRDEMTKERVRQQQLPRATPQ